MAAIITKEDLLRIREIAAENGTEFTPYQILQILRQIRPELKFVDEPGLVSIIRELRENT